MYNKDNEQMPNPVIMSFMQVDRLHHSCCDNAVSDIGSGLHRNQHGMLMFLCHHKGITNQKDIAEHLGISAAAVANTLKVLEQKGYIERKTDKSDTRKNIVDITAKGEEILDRTRDAFDRIDKLMIRGISEEELEIFQRLLDSMAENLRSEADKKEEEK